MPEGLPADVSLDVPTVFVATCDLAAQLRGRAVPAGRGASVLRSGVGWVPANIGLTGFGGISEAVPFGSVGDLRLLPDPAATVVVPGPPAVRVYLADLVELDGTPWPCCPRTFARRALADLRERHGLELRAAFEHEFRLAGELPGGPFSFERHRAAEPFGTDLVQTLDAMGFEPETWLPEYAADQHEITLAPVTGVAAADRAILLREVVRELAGRHGTRASFAPIAEPGGIGNGVHVHLSLETPDGRPALAEAGTPAALSDTGRRFAAGVLAHARAICAVAAPSPVSYLRLVPHAWSAAGAYAAERDREALLRICQPVTVGGRDPAGQLNLEFRGADALANPWLLLGMLVRAGLDGLDGAVKPELAGPDDAEPLPRSLAEALDALTDDGVVASWWPDELLASFLAVRREELSLLGGLSDAERCRRVSGVY